MSKQRLDQIISQLNNKGWEVINAYSNNLYYVSNEYVIKWIASRGNGEPIVITFFIVESLGMISTDLNDIFYCKGNRNENKLYFSKINSKEWKESLKIWVNNLNN